MFFLSSSSKRWVRPMSRCQVSPSTSRLALLESRQKLASLGICKGYRCCSKKDVASGLGGNRLGLAYIATLNETRLAAETVRVSCLLTLHLPQLEED
jgi:hypothetical protein